MGDIAQLDLSNDELFSTTRAVRKRLDLERSPMRFTTCIGMPAMRR